jgi:hypothetical protein
VPYPLEEICCSARNVQVAENLHVGDRIMLETPILLLIGLLVLCAVVWWVYRK